MFTIAQTNGALIDHCSHHVSITDPSYHPTCQVILESRESASEPLVKSMVPLESRLVDTYTIACCTLGFRKFPRTFMTMPVHAVPCSLRVTPQNPWGLLAWFDILHVQP